VIINIGCDGFDQSPLTFESSSMQSFIRNLAEPAFDHVEPGTGSGNKVQMKTRIPHARIKMQIGGYTANYPASRRGQEGKQKCSNKMLEITASLGYGCASKFRRNVCRKILSSAASACWDPLSALTPCGRGRAIHLIPRSGVLIGDSGSGPSSVAWDFFPSDSAISISMLHTWR